MIRTQKIIVRERRRQASRSRLKSFFLRSLKGFLIILAVSGIALSARWFLFYSSFFMIESVQVETEGRMTSQIAREVAYLKGQSIWEHSLTRIEGHLSEKFPSIFSVKMTRILPNRIFVRFKERRAIATTKNGGSMQGVDEAGGIFPLSHNIGEGERLPEIVFASSESLHPLLDFVKMWSSVSGTFPEQTKIFLHEIYFNTAGELMVKFSDASHPNERIRMVWGSPDRKWFHEKFDRFREVFSDLRKKSMRPQVMNLTGVPQKNDVLLEKSRMVGKVIVRPIKDVQ